MGWSAMTAAQTPPKAGVPASKSAQSEASQLYRNSTFGFRFQIPYGWVDRTKEMHEREADEKPNRPATNSEASDRSSSAVGERSQASGKNSGAANQETEQDPSKEKSAAEGEVLLAVFERPPDARGETINSAVVIASESAAAYPGLKKAEDYLGPLTELTAAKGFKEDGDPSIAEINGHRLIRADFIKPLTENLAMHQSTLVLLSKGHILSFTFIAGSDDEIDDLIENLRFVNTRAK